jgi:uncharacterized glyoxalase superfamily protein PhnB
MTVSAKALLPDDVVSLRPFVPATDFETSLRFYSDLGFTAYRLSDSLASMHLGPFAFLLQNFHPAGFATNFMMHLLVKDVENWWRHIESLDLSRNYDVQAPSAPALQPWGLTVAYVFDPSGVLWHVAQNPD